APPLSWEFKAASRAFGEARRGPPAPRWASSARDPAPTGPPAPDVVGTAGAARLPPTRRNHPAGRLSDSRTAPAVPRRRLLAPPERARLARTPAAGPAPASRPLRGAPRAARPGCHRTDPFRP